MTGDRAGGAGTSPVPPPAVAIVGMECIFPGAPDLATYWRNIVDGVDAVGDPPEDWGADLYYDPSSSENDRVYTTQGGWLGDLARFDPVTNGVMPTSVDGGEPDQFLALEVAHRALRDAGGAEWIADRSRAGVIIGRGTYVNRSFTNVVQHGLVVDQTVRLLAQLHPEHTPEELQAIKAGLKASLPPFNAEMAPGLVPNVMSGRIANRLDLMGPNFTVDAACASSLLAVDLAIEELRAGRCDVMLAGGVHASTPAPILQIFCQLEALSRTGRISPFDERADGTLLGEGLGFVVLKRHDDALRDGDRVYALIRSVGVASDGRAQGLLAPRVEGEELALRRAYEAAGVDPATVELVEAHGTGTPVGDAAEVAALTAVFGPRGAAGPTIALGTVKSMISHLIPASGMAGLIKTALALHRRVLPPTLHCERVNPALGLERSSLYLNTVSRPWVHGARSPRRAGVDSFGFGGINAHAVLEEAAAGDPDAPFAPSGMPEVMVLDAGSRAELRNRCSELATSLDEAVPLAVTAAELATDPGADPPERLTVVASSVADLRSKLAGAADKLADAGRRRLWNRGGVYYVQDPLGRDGRLALVFPGEGSQYVGMLADVVMAFPTVRRWFDLLDRAFEDHPRGFPPSHAVYPPPGDPAAEALIWRMDVGPESIFAASQGLLALLRELGLRVDAAVGHSTGEWSALVAAGALAVGDDERVVRDVAALNRLYERLHGEGTLPRAVLLTVGGAARDRVDEALRRAEGRLALALDNCPSQVVLCGDEDAAAAAEAVLQASGAVCQRLPFDRPYHTPAFDDFARQVRRHLDALDVHAPTADLYSCRTAARFPRDPAAIRDLAAEQWAHPVRFRETVEQMYGDGVRLFVEVGPRANLTAFVDATLRGRPHLAVASDAPGAGLAQLTALVAQLLAHRVPLDRFRPQAPAVEPRGRRRAGLRLATGLQPLRLPADVAGTAVRGSLEGAATAPPSTAPDRPAGAPLRPVVTVAPPVRAASPAEPRNARDAVMQGHLRTMERFLDVQSDVVRAFLTRQGATGTPPDAAGLLQPVQPVPPMELATESPRAGAPPPGGEAPEASGTAAPTPGGAGRAPVDLTALVRGLLQDRTGYPEDLLGEDLDLEADLGIDSIKRVEILGAVRERMDLPAGALAGLRGRRTIRSIVEGVASALGGGSDPPAPPADEVAGLPAVADLPYVDEVLEHLPGERLVVRCTWDVTRDHCLLDHTIERDRLSRRDPSLTGLPVVALTLNLELLAEVARAFAGRGRVTAITDVSAHRWTTLHEGRRALWVTAGPATADQAVLVSAHDDSGQAAGPRSTGPLLTATVHLRDAYPDAPPPDVRESGDGEPGDGENRHQRALYGPDGLFHGPCFQVVRSLDRMSADGAVATLVSRGPEEMVGGRGGALAIDPALLDGPGQVLAHWLAGQQDTGLDVFPVRLASLQLFAAPAPAGRVHRCLVRVREVSPDRLCCDVDVVDEEARLVARFTGWEDVRVTVPEPLRSFLARPGEAYLAEIWTPPAGADWPGRGRRLDGLPSEVLEYGGLWLGVLAHCVLAGEERTEWGRLAGAPARRRAEWLAGRIAAKEAVRDLLLAAGERDWADCDIRIGARPDGGPVVTTPWSPGGAPPSISIAHSDGVAVAVAVPADAGGVGVDVQPVRPLSDETERLAFSEAERGALAALDDGMRPVRATQLWCAKEAAAKAVGCGLPLPPSDVRVLAEPAADHRLRATVPLAGLLPGAAVDTRAARVTAVEEDGVVYALCTYGNETSDTDPPGAG
ncbi:MAG: acyltransferase protein [Modestobacter sp.]|nr:acyltransferase protein [Modestobacter sp.]